MLSVRISAVLAVLAALGCIVAFFIPAFYLLPLEFHIGIGTLIPAITELALWIGVFFAILRSNASFLIAAWSWSLALQVCQLVQMIARPIDLSATIAKMDSPEEQAVVRQMLQQAHKFDVQIHLSYCFITLIALVLVLWGDLNMRSGRASALRGI